MQPSASVIVVLGRNSIEIFFFLWDFRIVAWAPSSSLSPLTM